ncbi:IS5 family transposase [Roseovarius sp. SYSU LYC5161]|uniref:IS5 family transposase n=1 Tax=Roseovarius halophilus (ex Wu et al. 2025) TaxID=3376060 RepID=UPI00399AA9D4
MAQMGFFDLSDRYASLGAKKDPLVAIDTAVPWDEFRPVLEAVWRKPASEKKSRAGRKPMDAVLMFKTLVLGALYNLSDDQIEYQIRDRLSFMRFLGLGLGDRVPDAKTVWLYREALAKAGRMDDLFDGYLARQGYIARGGQILDASIVPVPKSRNTREENQAIKAGDVPEDWADKPAKRSQKDMDARWTKKHGKSHYGYKNHVNVDRKYKLVRRYHVTDAAVHDSQVVDHLLMKGNTGAGVWADAAYRSKEMEDKVRARKLRSHIHRKGRRGKPLGEQGKRSNRTKSTIRVRVEHVFGAQTNDMGGTLVRGIGLCRAAMRISLKNLTYNMRRFTQLRHLHPSPA